VVWSQLWQVTLLIVVVALLARMFCRNKPHLVYLLWMLVVLKCLTPPLWSSPTGLFSWMQVEQMTQLSAEIPGISENPRNLSEPMDFGILLAANEPVFEETVIIAEPVTFPEFLSGVWLFGVVFLTVVVAVKWIQLHRKLKQTTIPVDAELLSLVSRLKQTLGIRRRVQVLVTSEPVGPAVFGFLRPVIVLPQSLLAELSAQAIEPILAHELVHVRRFDSAAGLLQAIAQLVWWFHPLVWWANRQTSRERERCCDEEVVTGLDCLPTCYARSLLDVLELKRRLRSIFAVPGIRRMEITPKRVEDIMQRSGRFHRRTPRWCWGVILVAAALILPGAGLVVETAVKSELPYKGYMLKENKKDDSTKTNISTKARPAVTVATATQTGSEDKAVAALKDLGAHIRENCG
jgi:bla regulator protein BlaR1